eukprot:2897399-Rhodomonas_salina.4
MPKKSSSSPELHRTLPMRVHENALAGISGKRNRPALRPLSLSSASRPPYNACTSKTGRGPGIAAPSRNPLRSLPVGNLVVIPSATQYSCTRELRLRS